MRISKLTFVAAAVSLYILSSFVLWHFHKTNNLQIQKNAESFNHERESIDRNLRSQIVILQKKITNLPKIFTKNKRSVLIENINSRFKIESSEKLQGREVIGEFFSRNERKDIFSGKIVVQKADNKLFYAVGLMDESGEYTDSVERTQLRSENVDTDFGELITLMNSDISEKPDKKNYEESIALLKQICIDSAFQAENTRLEFVSKEMSTPQINNKFIQDNQKYNQEWLNMVLAIFAGNILGVLVLALFVGKK